MPTYDELEFMRQFHKVRRIDDSKLTKTERAYMNNMWNTGFIDKDIFEDIYKLSEKGLIALAEHDRVLKEKAEQEERDNQEKAEQAALLKASKAKQLKHDYLIAIVSSVVAVFLTLLVEHFNNVLVVADEVIRWFASLFH